MYKLINNPYSGTQVVLRLSDMAIIPFDQDNTDYQAYLKFLEEGGQPLPAEENQ
jgi:hypothetical protein